MKRFLILVVAATALWLPLSSAPAAAELCTIDAVPAATLLLPYFEVDLSRFPKFNKVEQTIISLQNASASPAIAHVVLWTDLSVPTLAFDVFLTGFDVEEINLTELFYTGEIDGLATFGMSGSGTTGLALGQTATGGLQNRGDLIKAHRGQAVAGSCYGLDYNRNVARGYVTIDNANQLSVIFPNDPGYFTASGPASNINQLWGTVLVKLNKSIQADLLVHVEAGDFSNGDNTFYGRYVGFDGSDEREPLGTTWGARYFSRREPTDIIVWRDSTVVQEPFSCSQLGQSGWYPLDHTQVLAYNEREEFVEPFIDPVIGQVPGFPAETQKVRVASSSFDVGNYRSGWLYLNLLIPNQGITQSYVWVRQGLRKRAALYPGIGYYDVLDGSGTTDASACGPAPSGGLSPIP